MRALLYSLFLLFVQSAAGQFPVGHTTVTFNDPSRTGGFGNGGGPGRQIQTEIYYPAMTAGDNTEAAEGAFPVVIFGHGFVMGWDAYANIWEKLVLKGYIVAFPRTEGGLAPNHGDFGLDVALLVTKMQELNNNASSVLFGHVGASTAVGGHSMGGGACILAANTSGVNACFALAPAETTPSAIAAASDVSVPAMIFSGSGDGVTPPEQHQTPIYNALSSSCKYHITITGGGHCYFANASSTCDLGEFLTMGGVTISRAEQHQITFSYLVPWLDFWLRGQAYAMDDINLLLEIGNGVTSVSECLNPVDIDEKSKNHETVVFPNPVSNRLNILHGFSFPVVCQILDACGRQVGNHILTRDLQSVDFATQPAGIYFLRLLSANNESTHLRFIKE